MTVLIFYICYYLGMFDTDAQCYEGVFQDSVKAEVAKSKYPRQVQCCQE